jgi:uncharacterized protein
MQKDLVVTGDARFRSGWFHSEKAWQGWLICGLSFGVFFLNDLGSIYLTKTAGQWVALDYASRFVALALIFSYAPFRSLASRVFRPRRPRFELHFLFWSKSLLLVFALFVFDLFVGEWARYFVWLQFPDTKLFFYPKIEWPPLYWVDITFGLALVAVSEELLSRAVLCWSIERMTGSILVLYGTCFVLFGAMHWGTGAPNSVAVGFTGCAFMWVYRRTGSLFVPMLAHYLFNLRHFW